MQSPAWQESATEQAMPSSQVVPSSTGVTWQPTPCTHSATLQSASLPPRSQFGGVPG